MHRNLVALRRYEILTLMMLALASFLLTPDRAGAQDSPVADRQNCLSTVQETLQPVRSEYCLQVYVDLLAIDEESLRGKPVHSTYELLKMMRDTGQLEIAAE